MSSLRKYISDVRSFHRLLSGDNRITDRAIASELRSNSLMLVKRETNLRRLWDTDTLFTTIPCLEMEPVSISECCGTSIDGMVARSREKIPSILEGIHGYVMKGVYTINAMGGQGSKFTYVTLDRYANMQKLRSVRSQRYFWIMDNHIYISDPDIEKIMVSAVFEADIPWSVLYPECGCNGNPTVLEQCLNPADRNLPVPGYLEKQVLELTSQKLIATYFRIPEDLNSNKVDGQAPNTQQIS